MKKQMAAAGIFQQAAAPERIQGRGHTIAARGVAGTKLADHIAVLADIVNNFATLGGEGADLDETLRTKNTTRFLSPTSYRISSAAKCSAPRPGRRASQNLPRKMETKAE